MLVSLLAASPGLCGSWVHDDLNMVGNPNYADTHLLEVVRRHSGTYGAAQSGDVGAMTQTYRPFTMLTLVATHLLAPRPLAHHVVGWVLHVLTAWLLWLALRASDKRDLSLPVHIALAGLFLLHPVGVESYVWINGRSDLMAGACLAALLLTCASTQRVKPSHACLIFVLCSLGSASKETFIPAVLASICALALSPAPGASDTRRAFGQIFPVVAAVSCYAVARFLILPPSSASLGGNPFASQVGWLFTPKLGAIASYALVSLRAANMQSLSWDMLRDLSLAEWCCGGLGLGCVIGLLVVRDWRGLGLTLAAAACLAPTVLVAFSIWLGFDRYLYMPLLLVTFMVSPHVTRAWTRFAGVVPRVVPLAAAGVLAIAAFNTFLASRAYRDQATWLATLAAERPADPTVVTFLAQEVGPPAAAAVLERLPPPPWPQSMIAPAITLAHANGLSDLAARVSEYGVRNYRSNPLIVALALRERYEAGHRDAALALLSGLSAASPYCWEIEKQLGIWADREGPVERSKLTDAASQLHCQP